MLETYSAHRGQLEVPGSDIGVHVGNLQHSYGPTWGSWVCFGVACYLLGPVSVETVMAYEWFIRHQTTFYGYEPVHPCPQERTLEGHEGPVLCVCSDGHRVPVLFPRGRWIFRVFGVIANQLCCDIFLKTCIPNWNWNVSMNLVVLPHFRFFGIWWAINTFWYRLKGAMPWKNVPWKMKTGEHRMKLDEIRWKTVWFPFFNASLWQHAVMGTACSQLELLGVES